MRWPLVTSTIALSASLTFCDAYRHGITYAATSSLPPSALPFNKLTHIDFTGFTVASDGALASPNVQVVEKLVDSAHAANVNVSIVIQAQGGSANLRAFFGDAGKREKLANEIAAAVSSRTFDGVQLHWEAPGRLTGCSRATEADANNLLLFLQTLRPRLQTTVQLGAFVGVNTFSKTATRALTTMLDEVTIQTFDIIEPSTSNMTGPNAPLLTCAASVAPTSVDAAVLLWRAASFPFNRILVGVSTHGYAYPGVNKLMKSTRSAFSTEVYNRHASLASGTCDDTVPRGSRVSLNQLIASSKLDATGKKGRGGYARHFDTCTSTPFLYSPREKTLVAYDDPASVAAKAAYAMRLGLAGVTLFDADGDSNTLLLDAARSTFLGLTKSSRPKKMIKTIGSSKVKLQKLLTEPKRRPH